MVMKNVDAERLSWMPPEVGINMGLPIKAMKTGTQGHHPHLNGNG